MHFLKKQLPYLYIYVMYALVCSCNETPDIGNLPGKWQLIDDSRVMMLISDSTISDIFEEEQVYAEPYHIQYGTDSVNPSFPDAIYIVTYFGYSKQHYRLEKVTTDSLFLFHTEGMNLQIFKKAD